MKTDRSHRSLPRELVLAAIVSIFASVAESTETDDHLECFPLVASKSGWSRNGHALDDLWVVPRDPRLGVDSSCRLLPERRPRPKELCVPAQKEPPLGTAGPDLEGSLLCYDAKCDGRADTTLRLGGAFGGGEVTVRAGGSRRRLCTPAAVCRDACVAGDRLDPVCSSCVADACAADPYCCEHVWDRLCVARAAEVCGCQDIVEPSLPPLTACARVTIGIDYAPSIPASRTAGALVRFFYPTSLLSLPGTRNEESVALRVHDLTGVSGGLSGSSDNDGVELANLTASRITLGPEGIAGGRFVAVDFDCIDPPLEPSQPNFANLCIADATDALGVQIEASCKVVSVETAP